MRARLTRPALALAASGLLATAGLAGAAPAPACNLVTDPKGDGTGFVLTDANYLPNDPQLDLVSGDVASDAKSVTAVIRLDQLAMSDSSAPTGRTYYANFNVGEAQLFLAAALDGAGTATYSGGFIETRRTSLGEATGVIDVAKKEVRISAPVKLFAEKAKIANGTKILNLNLLAQRYVGHRSAAGVTPSADAAEGGKTYIAGAKSCVVVGK